MAYPHAALIRLAQGHGFPTTDMVTMPIVDSAIEHGMAPLLDNAIETAKLPGDHDALIRLAMRRLDSAAAGGKILPQLVWDGPIVIEREGGLPITVGLEQLLEFGLLGP